LRLILPVVAALLLAHPAYSQIKCVELKNYEFFVGATRERWSEAELKNLIEAKPSADGAGWLVPPILNQLARYEPACGEEQVDRRFELILKLYSIVRIIPSLEDASVSLLDKLKLISDDFQSQLQDDKAFRRLVYTMDDGPLAGKPAPSTRSKPVASRDYEVVFGKLRFSNTRTGVVVTAFGRKGKQLWSRSLQGAHTKLALKKAQLETLTVEATDFVVVARIFVDGEQLTLYTRPNGRFMYYTHSW